MIFRKKRSTWASGKRYVPSCSIGFCVARTRKGFGSSKVSPPIDTVALLHRLEQGRLHLGRGAVDFVGQDEVGEDGTLAGREGALLRLVDLRSHEIGGQEVRRELHACKAPVNGAGEARYGQRFGEPRQPLQQYVAAGQEGQEEAVDQFVLTDDDLVQSIGQVSDPVALASDRVAEFGRGCGLRGRHGDRSLACFRTG